MNNIIIGAQKPVEVEKGDIVYFRHATHMLVYLHGLGASFREGYALINLETGEVRASASDLISIKNFILNIDGVKIYRDVVISISEEKEVENENRRTDREGNA